MKKNWTRIYLVAFVCLLALQAGLFAAPFAKKFSFKQPDGSTVVLWGEGDEFYAIFETLEGYTVLYDQALRGYTYAQLSAANDAFESSGVLAVKGAVPPGGLAKQLRINADVRAKIARERFQEWDKDMEVSSRWKTLKAERQQADKAVIEQGAVVVMAPPSFTTVGEKVGLTMLIDFPDETGTVARAEIVDLLNGDNYSGNGNNGSVKRYFQDNSNNQLTYTNVVVAYIRMTQPKTYYNDTSKNNGPQAKLLLNDAITIMTNLPNYATEILPTFSGLTVDGSNRVVACNVFFAGTDSGVWGYGLWPCTASLSVKVPLGNGIYLKKFQISDIGSSLVLGTFCHENGHMLCGFPDIYDYGGDSQGGAGNFCMMSSDVSVKNPIQICAYLKRAAGWATTVELDSASKLTATVESNGMNFNRFYRYAKPGVSTEYFLIENRQKTGRDASIPASGIAIWHIDELGDRDNQSLVPNTTNGNYEVTLVQADNLWHFENNVNDGDGNDLYYSGNTADGYVNRFNDGTGPDSRWWDGSISGINFRDFSVTSTSMTFVVDSAVSMGVSPSTGITSTGTGGGPFSPSSVVYVVTNFSGSSFVWAVANTQTWFTVSPSGGTLAGHSCVSVTGTINSAANVLAGGIYYDTLRFTNSQGQAEDQIRRITLGVQVDNFTELFSAGDNDLAYQSFTFTPNGSPAYYVATRQAVSSFPTDPAGGMELSLGGDYDGGSEQVVLSGGAQVLLYGISYTSMYVHADGYITFGSADGSWEESLEVHFSLPRVSALFDDLDGTGPSLVSRKQLVDRVVVTYENVTEYEYSDPPNTNNFQIELFFNGVIRLTYLKIDATDGLVGLSLGTGLPEAFSESDFTSYPLGPLRKLIVNTAFGTSTPARGTNFFGNQSTQSCTIAGTPVFVGSGTQYVCAAATVAGNSFTQVSPTNVTIVLTNDATLTWQWTTNYMLTLTANGSGTVDRVSDFYGRGSNVIVTATASNYYHFTGWGGDTNGCATNANQLIAWMTGPRSITAGFSANLATNNTPHWWLAKYNLSMNDAGALWEDGDGIPAWQEYLADTDPTNKSSVLAITNMMFTGSNLTINWQGGVWATQYIEQCTSLVEHSWVPLYTNAPPTAISGSINLAPASNSASSFYRIRAKR